MRIAALSLMAILFVAGSSMIAQSDEQPPKSSQQSNGLEEEVKKLKEELAKLRTEIEELKKLNAAIADLQRKDTGHDGGIRDLNAAIDDLAVRQQGGLYPRILGKMGTNKEFRNEIMRVTQGELVVDNKTGFSQTYYINGGRWIIPKGKHSIWVPFGKVRVRLEHEESQEVESWKPVKDPKTGKVTHHRLGIEIRYPKPEPKAY